MVRSILCGIGTAMAKPLSHLFEQVRNTVMALEKDVPTILRLSHKRINNACALDLAKFLETNTTVYYLAMDMNNIGDRGVMALARALEKNQTLHTWIIDDNPFGTQGARAIGDLLIVNKTLKRLDLGNIHLGLKGMRR